tara:strand:+ start:2130 stop:2945 length:816 start_codon:yes stop_codon:yes gene_type:complete
MNPYVNYPTPPYDALMPHDAQLWVTIIFGVSATVFWLYALYLWAKEKDITPILIMCGGALCVFAEPIVDVMGSCWFPVVGQWTWIETFGRKVPVMIGFAYMVYYGGITLITVRQFEQGRSVGQVWCWYLIAVAIEAALEPIPIQLGLWVYYGNQPFQVFDFPLWWPPVNAVGAFAAALLIYKLKPMLKGFSLLLLVPLVPSGDLLGNAATAWPIWNAIHTSQGYLVTSIAGVLTLVLCAVAVQVIARLVAKDSQLASTTSSPLTTRSSGAS